jgi:hypothetical protein
VRKPVRIAVYVLGGLLIGLALGVLGLYLASRHVPAGYRKALEIDPATLAKGSDEMVRKTTALASQVKKGGKWQARFTAEEINGWFAVDMKKNHANLLPPEASDPRVTISPEQMTLFCRYQRGGAASVLSLAVDVYLAEPNVVALRIRRARAGALPLPLDEVLEQIKREAQRRQQPLQWQQAQGDPVAIVPLSLRDRDSGRVVRVETLELREGEIVVSGTTQ